MAPLPPSHHALLLLPGLSFPLDKHSLRAAYKSTLDNLLPRLSKQITGLNTFRLDIGLVLPQAYATTNPDFRTHIYPSFQSLLGEVYTLVCLVAAANQIDLDIPSGLDVRVILIESPTTPPSIQTLKLLSGPLVNLPTLIPALSTTTQLYTVESEAGIALSSVFTHHYQTIHHQSPSITRLPSGPSLATTYPSPADVANPQPLIPSSSPTPSHSAVAVGGTFDHLHIGHKLLLTFTIFVASPTPANKARNITVGITTDKLLENKKHGSVLESWELRQKRTAEFVESILVVAKPEDVRKFRKEEFVDRPGPNGKVVRVTYTPLSPVKPGLKASGGEGGVEGEGDSESSITINYTSISDPFGPTITEQSISALVISAETRAGGKAVNDRRAEKGWDGLEVFEVDILDASPGVDEEEGVEEGEVSKKAKEGFESKISSTEIRRRIVEIEDREKEKEKEKRDGKL